MGDAGPGRGGPAWAPCQQFSTETGVRFPAGADSPLGDLWRQASPLQGSACLAKPPTCLTGKPTSQPPPGAPGDHCGRPPIPHCAAPRAHSSLRHGLASPCTGKGKPLSRMPAHGVSFLLPRFVLGRPAALAQEELGCLCHLEVPGGLPDPQPGRHVSLHRSELMGSPDGHIHRSHQMCAAPPSWIPCRHPTSCTPRSRTRPAPDSSH